MRGRALFLMAAFFLAGCQDGETADRSFRWKLHNPRNGFSTLHSMPDGALLVVTKQIEQPKQIWHLRRITNWDATRPREEQLDVDVGPNKELLAWSLQEDRQDQNAQLMMDPGGNYLVVRYHASDAGSQSVLNIIALHGFKLLRRAAVPESLQTEGDMGFSPSGAFVVSGSQDRARQFPVQTLTLPDLKPETVCGNNGADCSPALAALGFSSFEDVRKRLNSFGMREYYGEHSGNVPEASTSPWGCQFASFAGDMKYEALDCDESRAHLTFFSGYRGFRVFRLADGMQIMDLNMPRSPEFSGVLAMGRGVRYVVLLRGGATLEGYKVPQ